MWKILVGGLGSLSGAMKGNVCRSSKSSCSLILDLNDGSAGVPSVIVGRKRGNDDDSFGSSSKKRNNNTIQVKTC